ncbi:MAG: hypothetical protein QMC94_01290 [Anaerosomatales bacterium]|nr:hypothetical protein [Anaerosomatales bacterium]
MDAETRRIAIVAHCLLNRETKVRGLAHGPGAHPLVHDLLGQGMGVVQLPCPEASYLGMNRWGMTYEQYDVPAFRRHCVEILRPTVETLEVLHRDGTEIASVIGVDGSPNCGVAWTCRGYTGGEPEDVYGLDAEPQRAARVAGPGVFFEILKEMLDEAGIEASFEAVPEESL